jgi:hypothetical protein
MFGRGLLLFAILGAAVGIPYLSTEWSRLVSSFSGEQADESTRDNAAANDRPAGDSLAPIPPVGSRTPGAALPGNSTADPTPVVDLAEAFRFDVTPGWIFQRWPRVTTAVADERLQGYRVMLITGTRDDDLAGALTYYFNPQQRCQRIAFQGTTGDPRRLARLLVERFQLRRQASDDAGLHLYQTRWNGKPISEAKIRPASVVRANAPLARYEVSLMINNAAAW